MCGRGGTLNKHTYWLFFSNELMPWLTQGPTNGRFPKMGMPPGKYSSGFPAEENANVGCSFHFLGTPASVIQSFACGFSFLSAAMICSNCLDAAGSNPPLVHSLSYGENEEDGNFAKSDWKIS